MLPPGGGDAYEALQVGRGQPVRRASGEVKRQVEAGQVTRAGAAKSDVDRFASAVSPRTGEPTAKTTTWRTTTVGPALWTDITHDTHAETRELP